MKIFIPRERRRGERRVAATPETTRRLLQLGFAVAIETHAGVAASFADDDYREAGATIATDARRAWADADIVLKVQPPDEYSDLAGHEADLLLPGGVLISFLWPGKNQPLVSRLAARQATAVAIDQIPRITRAQKIDALSSMANSRETAAAARGARCATSPRRAKGHRGAGLWHGCRGNPRCTT